MVGHDVDHILDVPEEEITTTAFAATVTEDESYCFEGFAAQDVRTSLRLTHISYHPPASLAALESYYSNHPTASPPITTTDGRRVTYAVAEVEDIGIGMEQSRFVVGCFPLDLGRLSSGGTMSFPHGHEMLLQQPTDVLRCVNIRLDVDGSVRLHMRGPGAVFFYGEQLSALIPEWENHRFFKVDGDDEEMMEDSDMSDGELNDMLRHARD